MTASRLVDGLIRSNLLPATDTNMDTTTTTTITTIINLIPLNITLTAADTTLKTPHIAFPETSCASSHRKHSRPSKLATTFRQAPRKAMGRTI